MYDVAIVGGGPGGYNAAIRAGPLGLKLACIEGSPQIGGTCLNVGCMPSKALLHASKRYEDVQIEFAHLGIEVTPTLNLSQMMAQKADSVTRLVKGVEFLFRKNKVDWIQGRARFTAPGKITLYGIGSDWAQSRHPRLPDRPLALGPRADWPLCAGAGQCPRSAINPNG